jgi:hypothetical protein
MHTLDTDLFDFAHAIVRGAALPPNAAAHYRNYSAEVALEVYRNNYRGNLHDALAGAYPVTLQLVGRDFFRLLARNFIEAHPSRSGNLHGYGAELGGFIASFAPARTLPYLPDVAALEWACHCAYFADDAAGLDLSRLAQVPPALYPELVLRLHPACRLVRSPYPIAAIWQAHQPGAEGDFSIDLGSGPCRALVSRRDGAVQVSELSAPAADWLQDIQAGWTLGAATDSAQARHNNFDLQTTLLDLVARDAIADFYLKDMPCTA